MCAPETTSHDEAVIVGSIPAAARETLAEAVAPFPLKSLPPGPWIPWRLRYRNARIALVADVRAMPSAAAVQRLARVPWVAVVIGDCAIASARPSILRQAAAVVVGADVRDGVASGARRIVDAGDAARLRAVLADIAVAGDARTRRRTRGAALADAWTFVNDRAARLATRLVPITRKAPQPIHPKHLLGVPWHHWYADEIPHGARVLDVGCGNGAHTFEIAQRASFVVGVDVDAAELRRAEARARADSRDNTRFVHGDLTSSETLGRLPRQSFDVVVAFDVVEHLVDRIAFLRAAAALVAPNGKLLLSIPNRDTPYKLWRRRLGGFAYVDPDHKIEYTEESLRSELAAAGIDILRLDRAGYDTPFAGLTALVGVVSLTAYRKIARRRHRLGQRRPEWATAFRVVARPATSAPTTSS